MKKRHKSLLLKVVLCAVISSANLPAYADVVIHTEHIGTAEDPHLTHPGITPDEVEASNTIINHANVYVAGRVIYLHTDADGINEIINHGVVHSSANTAIQTYGGTDTLTNSASGTITVVDAATDGIALGTGIDIFYNYGTVTITVSDGSDIPGVSGAGVDVSGIYLDAGDDIIDNSGTITIVHVDNKRNAIRGGSGDDKIYNRAGGIINITTTDDGIGGGGGNDRIENDGIIVIDAGKNGIAMSGDTDTIINRGEMTISAGGSFGIVLVAGCNTLTLDGTKFICPHEVQGGSGTNNNLNLQSTGTRSFDYDFARFDTVTKSRTSTWILGGDVTGTTTTNVDEGALLINGTLESKIVNVKGGATLGGTGTITGNVVYNSSSNPGGTIAPGGSVGTLTITGDFESDANTTFDIEMDASAADLLAVSGTATINDSTISVTPTGIIQDGDTYDIITAETVTGTGIASVTSSKVLSFTVVDTRDPAPAVTDTIQLVASRATYASVVGPGLAPIAAAIDAACTSATGDLAACITCMDACSSPDSALKKLSPQTHGNTPNVARDVLNRYVRTFVTRMQSLRSVSSVVPGGSTKVASNLTDSGPVLADIASVVSYHYKNWSAWMEFFGQIGKQSNKNDKLGYSYNAYGPAFGMDTRLSDNAIIGLSTGYVHTNADTNGIDSSTNVNAFNLTAYGTYYETKEYYLDAAFTYGWNWYDSKRVITGLGYATSDHEGYELSVYGGGGYYLDDLIGWDWISIIPIASVQYMHHGEDSFSETANNTPFMNIDSIESDSLISRFGLCLEHLFKIKFKTKTVDVLTNVSGQWGHEYLDTKNTVPAQFAQSTASAFDTDGVEADRDSFLFGAGFVASVTENLDLFFDYNMDLRDTFHAHNFAIRARFKW